MKPENIPVSGIIRLLEATDDDEVRCIFAAAKRVKQKCGKVSVLKRALVECSNCCAKDCLYCGIRRSNTDVLRYRLPVSEVVRLVSEARESGFVAVAFQAGEIENEENTSYYEELLGSCSGLEVTLSLGEQEESVYRRWREAGAMRYLLRIESSDRDLFAAIHPHDCSFDRRLECLRTLKRLGYFTGTGVMIGLPGQTVEMLARDIVFFGREKMDMVGMGPYLVHPQTPMASGAGQWDVSYRMTMALRMIAVARLYLHSVNIVSATALEAIAGEGGRNAGIESGANVIMPVMTPVEFRKAYDIYPGKCGKPVQSDFK